MAPSTPQSNSRGVIAHPSRKPAPHRPSRLDSARRRAASVRRGLMVTAIGSFGAVLLVLRGTAGTTTATVTAAAAPSSTTTARLSAPATLLAAIQGSSSSLGGGSIASSSSGSSTSTPPPTPTHSS